MDSLTEVRLEGVDMSVNFVRKQAERHTPFYSEPNTQWVTFKDFEGKHGGMSYSDWRIEIDVRHSFGIKLQVHELLHYISRKGTHGKTWIKEPKKFVLINEWLTELITRFIFLENYKEIREFRSKYRWLLMTTLEKSNEELEKFTLTRGCQNTWWFYIATNTPAYENAILLCYAIIDLLTYISWSKNLRQERTQIWNTINDYYFNGDIEGFRWLIVSLKEVIDVEALESLNFWNHDDIQEVLHFIQSYIQKHFFSEYTIQKFPEWLSQEQDFFITTLQ